MSTEIAVVDTVNLFHLCVDRRDWATARSCLADTVRVAADGTAQGRDLPAEQFLGMIRSNVESFAATQHLVSGHHVSLGGDATARCQASYQNHHVSDLGRWVLAGQQDVELHRAGDRWQITAVTLRPAWEEGRKPAGRPETGLAR
jgi:SnoaL-like domain